MTDSEQASRADAAAPTAAANKTIVLFSDGTGNSSGKLFRTNVFRLYEALDLGPDAQGRTTQIAYYDNGVGTSSIKLLAVLGGVFGFGLKRNVLHLYRFLCRNYNPGDRIYAFGFSRGAFTIRLLVGLICQQGIVPYEDERELAGNSADAFYRFADANGPDVLPAFWHVVRWARNAIRLGWRRLRGRPIDVPGAHHPDVEFVGAWDTVAAYGGPISEITRGIDQYVWPLTMTNFILHPKVRAARHALAIDDARDSFWPLLWDEVSEARNAADPRKTPEDRVHFATRLKQVWFAGMHSDIGGGYPDDSLAYVSLVWMMDEVAGALRFLPDEDRRIRGFANAFGPMHDSRSGMGVYYRYQPRKIAALLHRDVSDTLDFEETLILRDPTVGEEEHRPQGLLTGCRVHASVIERIGSGTDNYAPIVLPRSFEIVGSATAGPVAAQARPGTTVAQAGAHLADPAIAAARGQAQENAWDEVWHRRVGYFVTVALTVLLLAAPLYVDRLEIVPPQDSRWVLDIVIAWFGTLVPGFAAPWFAAFQRLYPLFVGVGVVMWIVQRRMATQAMRLGDRLRIAWWDALEGKAPKHGPPTALRAVRNGRGYQRSLQTLKWRILPAVVGLGIMPVLPIWLGTVIATQIRLVGLERDTFCRGGPAAPPALDGVVRVADLRADATCIPVGARVTEGRRYRVVLTPTGPGWSDGAWPVPPSGAASIDYPWIAKPAMLFFAPFQRVVPARWLEPLVQTRSIRATGSRARIAIQRLHPLRPPPGDRRGIVAGEFVAQVDGNLSLFLNDAVGPWGDPAHFYTSNASRNRGTASVCIEDTDQRQRLGGPGCDVDAWTAVP